MEYMEDYGALMKCLSFMFNEEHYPKKIKKRNYLGSFKPRQIIVKDRAATEEKIYKAFWISLRKGASRHGN
jgi:uncharacterized protein YktA (UPF0223 family)